MWKYHDLKTCLVVLIFSSFGDARIDIIFSLTGISFENTNTKHIFMFSIVIFIVVFYPGIVVVLIDIFKPLQALQAIEEPQCNLSHKILCKRLRMGPLDVDPPKEIECLNVTGNTSAKPGGLHAEAQKRLQHENDCLK